MKRQRRVVAGFTLALLASCSASTSIADPHLSVSTRATPSTRQTEDSSPQPAAGLAFFPSLVAFWDSDHGLLAGALVTSACARTLDRCDDAIEATSNGGKTWHRALTTSATLGGLTTLLDSDQGWATVGSRIAHTSDRGKTWRLLPRASVVNPSFATTSLGLGIAPPIGGEHVMLARTADGGRSWTSFAAPCTRLVGFGGAVSFPSPGQAWLLCYGEGAAGQESKEIFTSRDQGTTWEPVAAEGYRLPSIGHGLPSYGYPNGLSFRSDGEGWMSYGGRGYLLASSDGGSTWRVNHAGTSDVNAIPSVSFVTDLHGYALRLWGDRRSVLLVTADAGDHWHRVQSWRPL
jgi:photosystem II stability/assembly factor-like uncharacterized protein